MWSLASIIDRNAGHRALHRRRGSEPLDPSSRRSSPTSCSWPTTRWTRWSRPCGAANYVLATVDAQQLMQLHETALAAGFPIGALDDEITSRLDALAASLPPRVIAQLQDTLGSLFPQITTQPGGGGWVCGRSRDAHEPGTGRRNVVGRWVHRWRRSHRGQRRYGGCRLVGGGGVGRRRFGRRRGSGGSGGPGPVPGTGRPGATATSLRTAVGTARNRNITASKPKHEKKPKHDKKPKHHGKP